MKSRRLLRLLNIVAGLALSGLFAWLAFRGVHFGPALAVARRLDPAPFAGAVAIFAVMMLVRSERWRLIMRPVDLGFAETLRLFVIGAGALYVFPARLGELIRPVLLGRRGRSRAESFATVALERLLDGSAQVLLFLLLLTVLDVEPWIRRGGILLALVYFAFFLFLVAAHRGAERLERLLARAAAPFPAAASRLAGSASRFAAGLTAGTTVTRLLAVSLLSLVAWALSIAYLRYLLAAFGLALERPWLAAAFLQFMLSVGLVIPAAPGYIGTFHYFTATALGFFGVARDEAAGFALFLHALNLLLVVGPAIPLVLAEGLGIADFTSSPAEPPCPTD